MFPAAARSTFLKKNAQQDALKNVSFELLLVALALSIPLRRAYSAAKNLKQCCSREGLEHFFDLRPFFNHNLQFIFAISVTCFRKFDFWCLLACFFFIFFANVMKMCSPPSVGSTFPKNSFCNYRVQEAVSIPKLASKPPLMGGHFRLVLCKL